MTTNKTFLILLLAGVSYTAYNATAVSENFIISTTIDHEIVLGNLRTASTDVIDVQNSLNFGTIVIDKNISEGTCAATSAGKLDCNGGVIEVSNTSWGRFIANVDIGAYQIPLDYFSISPWPILYIGEFEVGGFDIVSPATHLFEIRADFGYSEVPHEGTYSSAITITYTPL
ncbi:MAG: hypothetical protein IJ689_06335 [Alphaproteobacteria bacterium]|nr:hypothetical protein [Alphaproteobacteria bacterium]